MGRQATSWARAVALTVSVALAAACGEEAPPGGFPIDREVFIETYVDLRAAALRAADFIVSPEVRDDILEEHGVDEEALLHFADVHGTDLEFMNEVWAEVERRLEERRPTDDAAG